MDSTNSPQTEPMSSEPVAHDTPTETQPTAPEVQGAEATLNLSTPGSNNFTKPFLIGLVVLFVLIIVGVVGNYFLIAKYSSENATQEIPMTTSDTTKTVVSPTPINEQDEVDKVDTTFPEEDINGIQSDLQGL